jgi:transposase
MKSRSPPVKLPSILFTQNEEERSNAHDNQSDPPRRGYPRNGISRAVPIHGVRAGVGGVEAGVRDQADGDTARTDAAGAGCARLTREIADAKRWFGVNSETPVRSCYEAGRDGFWLHRYLTSVGIANVVVDSASIEVNRRARRAKSDRLDARKLVSMLLRYHAGERRVGACSTCRRSRTRTDDRCIAS